MSGTNCGPNFIGPQGTTYTNARPNCGPSYARPFPQPHQISPPPLIFEGACLLAIAPSLVCVLEHHMPIMSNLLAYVINGNETST
jgi:hypothetical protein